MTPARAALLSTLVPGLGQKRAGHRRAGRIFLGLELAAWLLAFSWMYLPWISPVVAMLSGPALLVLRILGASHAVRVAGGRGFRLFIGTCALLALLAQYAVLSVALRLTLFEMYAIPSSAQEPTLMGPISASHRAGSCPFAREHGAGEGDRVVASRLAYLFGEIRRWDVAVHRFPLDPERNFVKRVVGLPGEELKILAGEIWTRAPGSGPFRIARKPLDIQAAVWIELDPDSLRSSVDLRRTWELDPSTLRVADAELLVDAEARLRCLVDLTDGVEQVEDRRTAFDVLPGDGTASVVVEFRGRHGRFEARWSAAEEGTLRHLAAGGTPRMVVPFRTRLRPDRWQRIELAQTDGRAVAFLDGAPVAEHVFLQTTQDLDGKGEDPDLSIAVKGPATRIRGLSVARDFHWKGSRFALPEEEQAYLIPADAFFVLGDNVQNSHDSRGWRRVRGTLPDGRTVFYEAQADGFEELRGVDDAGRPVQVPRDQVQAGASEPFPFIPRSSFVSRVTRVWWPLERARPIR
jgi:signal peptidase I